MSPKQGSAGKSGVARPNAEGKKGREERAWPTGGSAKGEFQSGTGALHIAGPVAGGNLVLDLVDFISGPDRTVICHGNFDGQIFYNAWFCRDHDRIAFAILEDSGHSTTINLSDADQVDIGWVVVKHDGAVPQNYLVSKKSFLKAGKFVDEKGKEIDLVGKRNPPKFTSGEFGAAFGNNPALLKFMRGRLAYPPGSDDPWGANADASKAVSWACAFLSNINGATFGKFWDPDAS